MNNSVRCFLAVVLLGLSSFVYGNNSDNEIEVVLNKLLHTSNSSVEKDLACLDNITCTFLDINYADTSRVYWHPIKHLERLNHLTEAYINPKHALFKSDYLYRIIVRGLTSWCNMNLLCRNWWFNEIAVPQQIGLILVNMRCLDVKKLPIALEKRLLDDMKNSAKTPKYFTGANRADIAIHWVYRACLTKNTNDLKRALDVLYEPLYYSKSEGIMIDNSFCQHGKQLYIGGYAIRFLDSITKIAYLFKDTKYALPEDKLNILCKFSRDCFFRTLRGKNFSYNVVGRNISRKGALNESSRIIPIARRLMELDPQHLNEYENVIRRLKGEQPFSIIGTSHTHYYYSDYTLHSSPSYTFDVRFSSNQTIRCETLNDENLKGYFLSEGSHCLMVNGDEYDGIFPVWNWTRIPGITAPQTNDIPVTRKQSYGYSSIAGGVSDSICGATALIVNDSVLHVYAKKSWFFFEHEIVCIGSDINSDNDSCIETSINQSVGSPNNYVSFSYGDSTRMVSKESSLTLHYPRWVLFNKVAYVFSGDQNVTLSYETQSGDWCQINKAYDNTPIKKRVFYLGVVHGTRPQNGSYSCRIIPEIDSENQIISYINKSEVEIVQHSSSVHAVSDSSKDLLSVVFFESGSLSYKNIVISVDTPCAIMIKGGVTTCHPSLNISCLTKGVDTVNLSFSSSYCHTSLSTDANMYDMKYGKTIKIII